MIPESFQVPALAAVIIVLALIIIIPIITINGRWTQQNPFSTVLSDVGGTSCALPPALDIEEGGAGPAEGVLPIDEDENQTLETATFALG